MEISSEVVVADRRSKSNDRRNARCRSKPTVEAEVEVTKHGSESERRRQDRRRQIDPTTCERDYAQNEVEFMRAMDDYKRKSGRPFPTWSEVLEVLMSLGYRQVAEPSEMQWRTHSN